MKFCMSGYICVAKFVDLGVLWNDFFSGGRLPASSWHPLFAPLYLATANGKLNVYEKDNDDPTYAITLEFTSSMLYPKSKDDNPANSF